MSNKTKLIGVLEGAALSLGLYSIFMSLAIVVIRMSIAVWWDDSPPVSLWDALPKVLVFLVLAVGAIVLLERTRRASGEAKPPRLAWLGMMFAGVVVGVAIGHIAWSTTGRMKLRGEIASLEKAGLAPPDPSGKTTLADADNAVTLLEEASASAAKTLGPDFSGSSAQVALQAYLDRFNASGEIGAEHDAVVLLLASNQAAVELVVKAADRKGAEWRLDFTPPVVNMKVPDHLSQQQIAKLLCVQAIERSKSGDVAGSAQSIRAGLAMAESVGASPLMLSQMFRIALHTVMLNTAKQIFDTPAELAIAEPAWSPYLDPPRLLEDVKTSLRLEYVTIPREIASGAAGNPLSSFPLGGAAVENIASAPVFYYGMAGILKDQRPLFESVAPGKKGAPVLPPGAPRYISRAGMGAARVELARAALAWAKTPGDPAKGIGSDPYAEGEPLRAISASGGTLIFSVGPDRKDDKGAAFDKTTETGDLSWLVRPNASIASK